MCLVVFWLSNIAQFVCGFSLDALISSHSPEICILGIRVIGNSKSTSEHVGVNGCLFLYVAQQVPCISPFTLLEVYFIFCTSVFL